MVADMGYANAFTQAGLIDDKRSSKFSAILTSSGSWFSTRIFYSQKGVVLVVRETGEFVKEILVIRRARQLRRTFG